MGVSVRTHRENPWDLLRLTRKAMPDTLLQFIGTGFRFISWEKAHPEVMALVYQCLVDAGMDRFVVLDPTHDMDAVRETARIIKRAGGTAVEVIAALTYTVSAVHDDAFYAGIAGQMSACQDIDRAYLKDPAGLLTPDRAGTLIPAVLANLNGKPLELHAHCTLGLSPLTCLTAADLGVGVLQVGCGALGNGTSLPDAEKLVANLRASGHTVDVDDRLLSAVARYFDRVAAAENLPAGQPREFDAAFMRHQVAGGVMTTLRRQLAELGMADRFGEVMEEVTRVRAELGYPIMVTPFPQMVIGQALANIAAGGKARYDQVPDQVIRYVLGSFGKPTAPVNPDVLDRILSRPRARELASEPPPLSVAGIEVVPPSGEQVVDAVFVGWFPEFTMPALEAACHAVWGGAELFSASETPFFASAHGRALGTSRAISAMIRSLTGCRLRITGKPSLDALRSAAARLGARPADIAVVGDDPLLEVPMAHRGRALAIAVDTGLGSADAYDHLPAERQPHLRLRGVDELLEICLRGA
jgi:oxaloacetate decarboxylase (Na+ extruding) subunit alpha